MISRCGIFKKMDLFSLLHNVKAHVNGKDGGAVIDKEKLETAVCFESVLTACYKSLICHIYNRDTRKEFLRLSHRSMMNQRELMKLLDDNPDSAGKIEEKAEQYLFYLGLGQMTVTGKLNLSINMATHTMDIYKYLSRICPQYGSLLDNLVKDNMEEIDFLQSELEFHQQKPTSI